MLASLFAVWLGDRWTGDAGSALGQPARAITLAKRARSLEPALGRPDLHPGARRAGAGKHPGLAHGLLLKATRVQPYNAETWYALGEFELELGCARHALPEFERFYELNPQDPGVAEKDKALKLVNSGKPRC